jgi:hypothetical protein
MKQKYKKTNDDKDIQIEYPVIKSNRGGARPNSGPKPMVPTDEEKKKVETLSGYGVPIEQIAALIRGGIDSDTLRIRFKDELATGKAKANAAVGQTLFQRATSGEDTTAAIWWSKTQMRWSETQKHELTGPDGGPLVTRIERVILGADEEPVIEAKAVK